MKKMKRLLAIILASLLILSSATAGASAYQAYKDDALTKYDFTDTAVLTTEQYASALLDYADKELKKANITMDLSILGKLDATSIDNALSSVYKLINGNKIILWMAGDLNSVNVDAIKSRAEAIPLMSQSSRHSFSSLRTTRESSRRLSSAASVSTNATAVFRLALPTRLSRSI